MTYRYCNLIIESGECDKESMQQKLDVFLLGNRLTQQQYTELSAKLASLS